MSAVFVEVDSAEKLEELFDRSNDEPVLLFKHSATCSISSDVLLEMKRAVTAVNLVVVQNARHISDLIAERTGLRHQSPQAILLKGGEAVFSASHYDISAEDVNKIIVGTS